IGQGGDNDPADVCFIQNLLDAVPMQRRRASREPLEENEMRPAKQLVVTSVLVFLLPFHALATASFKLVVRGGESVGRKLQGVDQNVVNLIVDFKSGKK